MAIPFLTGQRLTADLLNTNLIDYFPSTFTKTNVTTRAATISRTNDPDLQGIPLSVGTWEIELMGIFTTPTSNAPGISLNWAFTGTWTGTALRTSLGVGNANTVNPSQATSVSSRAWTLDTEGSQYRTHGVAGANASFREISRVVSVSVAGNLSLQWAQFVSDASNTNLNPGTHFNIRKIA